MRSRQRSDVIKSFDSKQKNALERVHEQQVSKKYLSFRFRGGGFVVRIELVSFCRRVWACLVPTILVCGRDPRNREKYETISRRKMTLPVSLGDRKNAATPDKTKEVGRFSTGSVSYRTKPRSVRIFSSLFRSLLISSWSPGQGVEWYCHGCWGIPDLKGSEEDARLQNWNSERNSEVSGGHKRRESFPFSSTFSRASLYCSHALFSG